MKEEELARKLEEAKLPELELDSHRNRLRMALLDDPSFGKAKGDVQMERTAHQSGRPNLQSIGSELFHLKPVWKYSLGALLILAIIAVTVFALPSLGPERAGLVPEGGEVTYGPRLSPENEAKVKDILDNDSEVQKLLGSGAVIHIIQPIEVTLQKVDPATGQTETVTESDTLAQVWINRGEEQWGVIVDLVQGVVVSISGGN